MKAEPGTYILLLHNQVKVSVQVGRWRKVEFEAGYYLYVGSAFGPGGVRARVLRHCRSRKPLRWHIDYLRTVTTPLGAWYTHNAQPREHAWAEILRSMDGLLPIRGFGCSDCQCESHLFHTISKPDPARFSMFLGGNIETWQYPNEPEFAMRREGRHTSII